MVSQKQRDRVLGYLRRGREEGAEVVLEGGEAAVPGCDGFYVKPALLAGALDNVAAREEIFGPVAYLAPFADEDGGRPHGQPDRLRPGQQRLDRATSLAPARVAEAMVAGNSWINAHNLFPHGVPYGGVNKSGMGGGVLSVETFWGLPAGIVGGSAGVRRAAQFTNSRTHCTFGWLAPGTPGFAVKNSAR